MRGAGEGRPLDFRDLKSQRRVKGLKDFVNGDKRRFGRNGDGPG